MYPAALKAYDSVNQSTMSARDIETAVLTKAALKLKACQSRWSDPDRSPKMADALRYNQRVWCIFQSELEKPDNPLPAPIRADLLRLIAFIDKRTLEVIANPAPEKLNILIDINHNIAAGLRTRPNTHQNEKAAA